ncbi:MAG: ROK family protein [Bacteroidales bacterium]|nr:ROK family protein [Bacteroidales bacterium]
MLLGIDIGGTTISLGLVEGTRIVKMNRVPSFPKDAVLEETIDYLTQRIEEIITPEVKSIGIGVPTLVDVKRGIVYNAMNIASWKEVPLKEILEWHFGIPVSVNNDANCFALGAAARLGEKHDVIAGVTLGTGTGLGIMVGSQLLCGANCGAGEVGSIPYNGKDYESFCSKKFFESNGWMPKDASNAAESGDKEALSFFEEFGRHLGELLSVVMYAYDPGCIVLGGGIANTYKHFKESMNKSLRNSYPYSHVLEKLQIQVMPQEDVALLGASLLN